MTIGRDPRRGDGWAIGTAIALAVLLAGAPPAAGGRGRALLPVDDATGERSEALLRPAASVEVVGDVRGIDPSGAPGPWIVGAEVDALARPCEGFDACPFVAATVTGAPYGNFSFELAPGEYFLVANRTPGFGGTEAVLDVPDGSGPIGPVALRAEPFEAYGNVSFVLPHWNPLYEYAANCNAALPCHQGAPAPPYGAQQPLLSWTSDGVFYVNATDELVFDDLANGTVRTLAPWVPLYGNLMQYEGIENTEFLTVDGTYVYEFGCALVCTEASPVEFYAVNTSTGRTFSTTLTGVDALDFAPNGQVDLIGEAGNLSIAAFVDGNGTVLGYDLWNATQWVLGRLPFFEANNLYWDPLWGAYLDVAAGHASPESVAQIDLLGPAPGTSLAVASEVSATGVFHVDGVDGLSENLSAGALEFTSQAGPGSGITYRVPLGPGGLIESLQPIWGNDTSRFGRWPNTSAYPNVVAPEHRPTIGLGGPVAPGYEDGWFENQSAGVDLETGTWVDSNVSVDHPSGNNASLREVGPSPAALEGLFVNDSYSIVPASYDCRTNGSDRPINGTATPATAPGTIWWSWRVGLPEFPFPATTPISETAAPAPPTGVTVVPSAGSWTVRWNASSAPVEQLLGYEVATDRADGGIGTDRWVPAYAANLSIPDPAGASAPLVTVQAWNLHGASRPALGIPSGVGPVGWLRITAEPFSANVTLDGRPLALSDGALTLPLLAGNYTLNATSPSYYAGSMTVEVPAGATVSDAVQLVGVPPVLSGTVTPASAEVSLDGSPISLAANGSFRTSIAPGPHRLTATDPGYLPLLPREFTATFGETIVEELALNRTVGWLEGRVAPSTAVLDLNGAPINDTGGAVLLRLPTGTYWVNGSGTGLRPAGTGPLNVTYLNTTEFDLNLLPYNGTIDLTADPTTARATVDGISTAVTQGVARFSVAPGSYVLDVGAPGFVNASFPVVVEENQSTNLTADLRPIRGWIEGSVVPTTAGLTVDGETVPLDADGTYNVSVTPGAHRVVAEAAGYGSATALVNVTGFATDWVNLTLYGPAGTAGVPVIALELVATAGAVVVAAVVVAWVIHRRRRPVA